jgi:hypothetical protein
MPRGDATLPRVHKLCCLCGKHIKDTSKAREVTTSLFNDAALPSDVWLEECCVSSPKPRDANLRHSGWVCNGPGKAGRDCYKQIIAALLALRSSRPLRGHETTEFAPRPTRERQLGGTSADAAEPTFDDDAEPTIDDVLPGRGVPVHAAELVSRPLPVGAPCVMMVDTEMAGRIASLQQPPQQQEEETPQQQGEETPQPEPPPPPPPPQQQTEPPPQQPQQQQQTEPQLQTEPPPPSATPSFTFGAPTSAPPSFSFGGAASLAPPTFGATAPTGAASADSPAGQPPTQQQQPTTTTEPDSADSRLRYAALQASATSKKPISRMGVTECMTELRLARTKLTNVSKLCLAKVGQTERMASTLQEMVTENESLSAENATLRAALEELQSEVADYEATLSGLGDRLAAADAQLADFATAADMLAEAGQRNVPLELARLLVDGIASPTCILMRRLSDAVRNLRVRDARARRYQVAVRDFWSLCASRESGRRVLELLEGDVHDPRFVGEPTPSISTHRARISAVGPGQGFFRDNVRRFVAAMDARPVAAGAEPVLSELFVRVGADSTDLGKDTLVRPRRKNNWRLSGDADSSVVGGPGPQLLQATVRRVCGGLCAVSDGHLVGDPRRLVVVDALLELHDMADDAAARTNTAESALTARNSLYVKRNQKRTAPTLAGGAAKRRRTPSGAVAAAARPAAAQPSSGSAPAEPAAPALVAAASFRTASGAPSGIARGPGTPSGVPASATGSVGAAGAAAAAAAPQLQPAADQAGLAGGEGGPTDEAVRLLHRRLVRSQNNPLLLGVLALKAAKVPGEGGEAPGVAFTATYPSGKPEVLGLQAVLARLVALSDYNEVQLGLLTAATLGAELTARHLRVARGKKEAVAKQLHVALLAARTFDDAVSAAAAGGLAGDDGEPNQDDARDLGELHLELAEAVAADADSPTAEASGATSDSTADAELDERADEQAMTGLLQTAAEQFNAGQIAEINVLTKTWMDRQRTATLLDTGLRRGMRVLKLDGREALLSERRRRRRRDCAVERHLARGRFGSQQPCTAEGERWQLDHQAMSITPGSPDYAPSTARAAGAELLLAPRRHEHRFGPGFGRPKLGRPTDVGDDESCADDDTAAAADDAAMPDVGDLESCADDDDLGPDTELVVLALMLCDLLEQGYHDQRIQATKIIVFKMQTLDHTRSVAVGAWLLDGASSARLVLALMKLVSAGVREASGGRIVDVFTSADGGLENALLGQSETLVPTNVKEAAMEANAAVATWKRRQIGEIYAAQPLKPDGTRLAPPKAGSLPKPITKLLKQRILDKWRQVARPRAPYHGPVLNGFLLVPLPPRAATVAAAAPLAAAASSLAAAAAAPGAAALAAAASGAATLGAAAPGAAAALAAAAASGAASPAASAPAAAAPGAATLGAAAPGAAAAVAAAAVDAVKAICDAADCIDAADTPAAAAAAWAAVAIFAAAAAAAAPGATAPDAAALGAAAPGAAAVAAAAVDTALGATALGAAAPGAAAVDDGAVDTALGAAAAAAGAAAAVDTALGAASVAAAAVYAALGAAAHAAVDAICAAAACTADTPAAAAAAWAAAASFAVAAHAAALGAAAPAAPRGAERYLQQLGPAARFGERAYAALSPEDQASIFGPETLALLSRGSYTGIGDVTGGLAAELSRLRPEVQKRPLEVKYASHIAALHEGTSPLPPSQLREAPVDAPRVAPSMLAGAEWRRLCSPSGETDGGEADGGETAVAGGAAGGVAVGGVAVGGATTAVADGTLPVCVSWSQRNIELALELAVDDDTVPASWMLLELRVAVMDSSRRELGLVNSYSTALLLSHLADYVHKFKDFSRLAGLLTLEPASELPDAILSRTRLTDAATRLQQTHPEQGHAIIQVLAGSADMHSQSQLTNLFLNPLFMAELERTPDCWREHLFFKVLALAWTGWDMPGLDSVERTRRIELLMLLLMYNVGGEALFLPFVGGDHLRGVFTSHCNVFSVGSILAQIMNAEARRHFRDAHPLEYARAFCERSLSTNDIETIFSELAQQTGYKPSADNLLARLNSIILADNIRQDPNRDFHTKLSKRKMYDEVIHYLTQPGMRADWNSAAALQLDAVLFSLFCSAVDGRAIKATRGKAINVRYYCTTRSSALRAASTGVR